MSIDEAPNKEVISEKTSDSEASRSDNGRRTVLKTSVAVAALLALGGIGALGKSLVSPSSGSSQTATTSFPIIKIANIIDIADGKAIFFNYPLEETPNILVKLGEEALQGVGPDGDIVAFSTICQHLGCIWQFVESGASPSCAPSYKAPGPVGYCCCHGSKYDLDNSGKVIGGPSPRPAPQVKLLFISSTGDIYATGMFPPSIFGHSNGSNDVTNDLQGGTVVTNST